LFAIIGFASMNTSMEKHLLMMALVFMVALYYLVLVLVEMLQFQIQNLLPFMTVILLLGSVVSFIALMMISPIIAWIHLALWIFIFALMCYKYRKEFQKGSKKISNVNVAETILACLLAMWRFQKLSCFLSREIYCI
jgi:hypothetical protein